MIELSRLNGSRFLLNHNLIETVEANPDTVIKLTEGTKYLVKETPQQVVDMIIAFNRQIFHEKTRAS